MIQELFVYGTLLTGEDQAGLLGQASRIPATTRGTLWGLPAGYPALAGGHGVVHGELVTLADRRLLEILDRYEGVDEGLYRRVRIDVLVGLRTQIAWAYRMENPRARGGRLLRSGRWRSLRNP